MFQTPDPTEPLEQQVVERESVSVASHTADGIDLAGLSFLARTVGGQPIVRAKLGSVEMECLWDTGSQVTIINEDLFRQHFAHLELVEEQVVRLVGANGLHIPYMGYTVMDVEVAGQVVKACGILIKTGTGDSDTNVVLGMNVIGKLKEVPNRTKSFLQKSSTCAKLVRVSKCGVHLPARSVVSVNVRAPVRIKGQQFVIEPLRSQNIKILVAQIVVADGEQWQFPLMNIGGEDLFILCSTPVGTVHVAHHVVMHQISVKQREGALLVTHPEDLEAEKNFKKTDIRFDLDVGEADCSPEELEQLKTLLLEFPETLIQHDLDTGYATKVNVNADLLSRNPMPDDAGKREEEEVFATETKLEGTKIPSTLCATCWKPKATIIEIRVHESSGKEGSTDETDIATSEKWPRQPDLGATQTLPSITPEELKRAQEQDPTIGTVIQFWNKGIRPGNEDRTGKNMTFIAMCRQWDRFCMGQDTKEWRGLPGYSKNVVTALGCLPTLLDG
ncbi:hypothetical protein ACOMHN_037035 [Nucella lapillus]